MPGGNRPNPQRRVIKLRGTKEFRYITRNYRRLGTLEYVRYLERKWYAERADRRLQAALENSQRRPQGMTAKSECITMVIAEPASFGLDDIVKPAFNGGIQPMDETLPVEAAEGVTFWLFCQPKFSAQPGQIRITNFGFEPHQPPPGPKPIITTDEHIFGPQKSTQKRKPIGIVK